MDKDLIIHVLRNPYNWEEATQRKSRLIAADIIDRLPEVVVHYYSKKYQDLKEDDDATGNL